MATCTHTTTHNAEWIDRRYSFFKSFFFGAVCEDCLDEMEADEFIEVTEAVAI